MEGKKAERTAMIEGHAISLKQDIACLKVAAKMAAATTTNLTKHIATFVDEAAGSLAAQLDSALDEVSRLLPPTTLILLLVNIQMAVAKLAGPDEAVAIISLSQAFCKRFQFVKSSKALLQALGYTLQNNGYYEFDPGICVCVCLFVT